MTHLNVTAERLRELLHYDPDDGLLRWRVSRGSGLLGVCAHKGRWQAAIKAGGKNKYLGLHDTPELAHAAYLAAKALHHPFQTLVEISA